ncbi:hypothetical protein [Pararhizobium sp.]|uniref:hypothetical protein n=1 Tax=Pararhizobium sp. TaxID=1977563 RepID=UPI003D0B64E9
MPTISKAEIWRGGETSNKVTKERRSVYVGTGGPNKDRETDAGVTVHLSLKSKGGGVSNVAVFFPPTTFDAVVREMVKTDREATIAAFAKAVLK